MYTHLPLLLCMYTGCIVMEYVNEAMTVRDFLRANPTTATGAIADSGRVHADLCAEFGRLLAKVHSIDVIHGDLTTSNILRRFDGRLVRNTAISHGASQTCT